MASLLHTGRSKYRGLTKKNYKRIHGSSTPGSQKCETCHATNIDKAMAKYPRSWKTFPTLYVGHILRKARFAKGLPIKHFLS